MPSAHPQNVGLAALALLAAAACGGGSGGPAASFAVGFEAAALTVDEDVGTATLELVLYSSDGSPLQQAASVTVQDCGSGSATSGLDYETLAPLTVVFPAGSLDGSRRSVSLALFDDSLSEGASETIALCLSGAAGVDLGAIRDATLSIVESKPAKLRFTGSLSSTPDEGNASYSAQVELVLPPATSLTSAVQVLVADTPTGTASAGSDYASLPPTPLSFPAGSPSGTTKSVSIEVLDDALAEGDESVRLSLGLPSPGAVLGAASLFQLNIRDDEVPAGPFLCASQGPTGLEDPLGAGSAIWLGSQPVGVGPNAGTLVRLTNSGTAAFGLAAPILAGNAPQDFSVELESASLASLSGPGAIDAPGLQLAGDVPAPLAARRPEGARGVGFDLDAALLGGLQLLPAATLHGFPLPGRSDVTLALRRVALPFSADARLVIDGVERAGGPRALVSGLSLWTGSALELPGSRVFLAFTPGSAQGFVELPEGLDRIVHVVTERAADGPDRPARVLVAEEWQLAALGVQPPADLCAAAVALPAGAARPEPRQLAGDPPPVSELGLAECRLAIETDYQLFQAFGSSPALASYVASLVAAVGSRYVTDVQTTLSIAYLGIYTSPADPWTSQDGGGDSADLLDEFRTSWNAAGWPAAADLAHFISGANLGGGIAYLDVLCNSSYGYGVSGNLNGNIDWGAWSGQSASFTWDFVVLAHELGHNFGTGHTHGYCPPLDQCSSNCSGTTKCGSGTLMSYCHTCAGGMNNIRLEFHPQVANVMRAAINTSCLGLSSLGAGDFVQYLVCFEPKTTGGLRTAALDFFHGAPNQPTPLRLQLQGDAQY